jgi:hypothetical protein
VLADACAFVDSRRVFVKGDQFGESFLLELGSQAVAPLPAPPGNSMMSPNGEWLARWEQTLDGKTGDVELWKLGVNPARVRVLPGSAGLLRAAFSPDGAELATADASGRLVHWNTATGLRRVFRDRTERMPLEAPDDASDALEAPVTAAELDEDRSCAARAAQLDPVTALLFSPDGRRVLVAYQGGNLQLWDVRSGKREAGHSGRADSEVLAWAADEARGLLTHDVTTMTRHALERIARGASMPGVIAVHQRLPIGSVVDDLVLVASCVFPRTGPIRSSSSRFDSGPSRDRCAPAQPDMNPTTGSRKWSELPRSPETSQIVHVGVLRRSD